MNDDDTRFSSASVLRGDTELGVAEVSANLYAHVTKYHAQIGANVDRDTLQQLEWNLLGEAKALFHQKKFDEALNTFTHCLAVTEKTRSAKDHAVRGAVIHNIASCLHNLGEMEAAQAYYDQAIDAFKKAKTPMLERMFYGDANRRRIDFVKERLVDITWGRKPDGDKYLDENGNKRPVPETLAGGEDGASPNWMGGERGGLAPDPAHYPAPGVRTHGSPSDARGSEAPVVSSARYLAPAVDAPPAGTASAAVDLIGGGYAPSGGGGGEAASSADAEQEKARKEWLQYHMQVGEWAEAAELVVTREERDDLEYLMQREKRAPPPSEQQQHRGHYHAPGAGTAVSDEYVAKPAQGRDQDEDNLL